jgi:tetraprenyl-beta-curcumene synthase
MRGPAAYRLERGLQARGRSDDAPSLPRPALAGAERGKPARTGARRDLALDRAFCATVARYLVDVLPRVRRELARLQARAGAIPDPTLRSLALDALAKRGNMEGAALFAVFAPRARGRETVRTLVAFQAAYNYLDTLAEQPSGDPLSNGRRLHEALLVALDPGAEHVDYYAYHPDRDDGGYLAELVDGCRSAFGSLPSYGEVSAAAWGAAARIVAFQSLNLTREQGDHAGLERWGREQTPPGSGLHWWQTAAAGGSSLAVHALIATAAISDVGAEEAAAIECAYFPWICALHSLLDSLVDVEEDERTGQRNLLGYHSSPQQAAFALKMLALRATAATRGLADARRHEVILAAMAAYYLSSPEAATPEARTAVANVTAAAGSLVVPALALFRARRFAARLTHGGYR